MKKNFLIAGAMTSLLLFTGCDTKSSIDENMVAKPTKDKKVGENFDSKEFKLTTVDGEIIEARTTLTGIDFKDYKGKVVLVDIFATWCPPCIKGIPDMNKLKEKYDGKFEIISVLFQDNKTIEEMQAFKKEHNIKYPIAIGDVNAKFAKELGEVTKVPEYYLYDKDGNYIKKFVGETDKSLFERYIDKAINN